MIHVKKHVYKRSTCCAHLKATAYASRPVIFTIMLLASIFDEKLMIPESDIENSQLCRIYEPNAFRCHHP